MKSRMIFVELNEFNRDLLADAADALSLKNLQRVLSLNESKTFTQDQYESDFLEPWVQWVSVHTGSPSSSHQIKHLGDVPGLLNKQIWEDLSSRGVSSGVWGSMNASRGSAENNRFFLPDPWTYSETAYPEKLNSLLGLARYLSKNYLNLSKSEIIRRSASLLKFLAQSGCASSIVAELPQLVLNLKKFHGEHFVFICLLDYISTLLFLQYRAEYQTDFSVLFLNSLAHVQHHHWHSKIPYQDNLRIAYCLRYLDRGFGHVFSQMGLEDTLVVTNALSQKNTDAEKPWILYRQKDQTRFLKRLGVNFSKVEPHMTHDAHIFFDNPESRARAVEILTKARVGDSSLFLVDEYVEDPLKIFYRIIFFDEAADDALFTAPGHLFKFREEFEAIVRRTGKHIQEGRILSSERFLPNELMNNELYQHVVRFFEKGKQSVDQT